MGTILYTHIYTVYIYIYMYTDYMYICIISMNACILYTHAPAMHLHMAQNGLSPMPPLTAQSFTRSSDSQQLIMMHCALAGACMVTVCTLRFELYISEDLCVARYCRHGEISGTTLAGLKLDRWILSINQTFRPQSRGLRHR